MKPKLNGTEKQELRNKTEYKVHEINKGITITNK